MTIEEMSSKSNMRFVNVTMSYEEVRDAANALYYLTEGKKPEQDYSEIAAKFSFLFDMVKHGMIQKETVRKMAGNIKEKQHA